MNGIIQECFPFLYLVYGLQNACVEGPAFVFLQVLQHGMLDYVISQNSERRIHQPFQIRTMCGTDLCVVSFHIFISVRIKIFFIFFANKITINIFIFGRHDVLFSNDTQKF